jgi:TonB family protein
MSRAGSVTSRLPAGADALLARLEHNAVEESRRQRQLGAAIGAALAAHAIALLLQLPEIRREPVLAAPRVVATLYPTPRLTRPVAPAVKPRPQTKAVPVPDSTPAEPEPIEAPAPPIAEPAIYAPVAGEVVPPKKLFAPHPPYPDVARRVRREGVVELELLVERDGTISSVQAMTDLGFGLEQSALRTISTWKLEPALLRGRPIPVRYLLHVRFELDWASAG